MIFAVLLLPISAMHIQDAQARSTTPLTAEQIAEKNAAARGGLTTWRSIQSLTMKGSMDAGKVKPADKQGLEVPRMLTDKGRRPRHVKEDEGKVVELPFQLELQRPHNMRLELEFAGATAVQVFDGTNGWKLRPFMGRRDPEPYTAEELQLAMQQPDMEGLLIDYEAKGYRLALDGIDSVDGKDAYKLALTLPDGQLRHVWVDTRTFLDVKMDGSRKLNGKERVVSTFIRSYKNAGGVKVPDLVETRVEGITGSEKMKIDKVIVNAQLDPGHFTKP
jgi:hypothetical protein